MPLEREQQVLLEAIRRAGEEVLRRYESFERIEDAPADISTDADRASQELILRRLHEAFPDDGLCGEESTAMLAESPADAPRRWIVDPIDGTRGFARKNGEFSIMIGLCQEGVAVLGAVYEPAIDRLTWASVDQPDCRVIDKSGPSAATRVTETGSLAESVFAISRSQKEEGRRRLLEAFGARDAVETYSAGIKLAQVARGEVDVYVGDYLTLKDWDVAAGHVLVERAGGRVTSVDGDPIRYDGSGKSLGGRGILATNGKVHDACLDVLRSGRYQFK